MKLLSGAVVIVALGLSAFASGLAAAAAWWAITEGWTLWPW